MGVIKVVEKTSFRKLFNGIEVPVVLPSREMVIPINFDNAATTPPLKYVDEFIHDNINMYGSVGRGGHKSQYCTQAYEISRDEVLKFFGVTTQDGYEVIYVKNTTEGINLLSHLLCSKEKHKVLTTRMEHHANDLPWRRRAQVYYAEVDRDGKPKIDEIEEKLKRAMGTINLVSVAGAGNVTGYLTPIHEIAKLAHQYGARIVVDAAQLVAHRRINLKGSCKEEEIDFIVFSGHKMYAPFGSGVVIAKKECIVNKDPFLYGGGMVAAVTDDDVYYKESPYKDEAGTPNFLGAMAIVAAMTVLNEVGFEAIKSHEELLKNKLIAGLRSLPRVILYGEDYAQNRLGVVPFNIVDIHHHQMEQLLQDMRGIAVRTGCFCAQPYVMRLLNISNDERYKYLNNKELLSPGMIRASFALYNTEEEVDEFLNVIEDILRRY